MSEKKEVNDQGRISVVIPAYNAERCLKIAVQSVFDQTRKPEQIIIVDDASSDNTRKQMQAYGDDVTCVYLEENSGPGIARNAGAALSTLDYIAFLDCDDYWSQQHLCELGALLDKYPEAGLAFSQVKNTGSESGFWPPPDSCNAAPENKFEQAMRNIFFIPSSLMVRRSIFNEIGGFRDIVRFYKGRRIQGEDFDFATRITLKTKVVSSRSLTAHHVWHDNNSSYYIAPQRIMHFRYRMDIIKDLHFSKENNQLYEVACDRTRLAWQEWIEWHWSARDMTGTREMVKYGLCNSLLFSSTLPYFFKSAIPSRILQLIDKIRSK